MDTAQRQQWLDFMAVQLHEFDHVLEELAELRAMGSISEGVAAQFEADMRLLQEIAGPAIAAKDLEPVNDEVVAACLRLLSLVAQELL